MTTKNTPAPPADAQTTADATTPARDDRLYLAVAALAAVLDDLVDRVEYHGDSGARDGLHTKITDACDSLQR